ncbi:early growth response [Fusarium tjaetaba]|uniref:Early growth response n=1 Tax=Fusarium tjaetaba TaxID=1567544 RepID=A0A8H5Q9K5_9HYPO|nr:early growth response [Fusarium tjaetaba]KAF5610573.1 early growth response [Fusarium tjaetaba]
MQRRRKTTKEERVCSICSQRFAKAEHLHRHVRSHTKEKPFTCPVCDKRFTRQDTLLRHSRSHQTPQHTLTEETSQSPGTQDGDSIMMETIHISDTQQEPVLPAPQHNTTNSITASSLESGIDEPITTGDTSIDNMFLNDDLMALAEQQYSWLPQWDAEINLRTDWLAELTRDQSNQNWLAPPMLDSVTEARPYSPGLSQPASSQIPAVTEPTSTSKPENCTNSKKSVQRRWHTNTDLVSSGEDTPDASSDVDQIDEACHRTLADKLRLPIQDGPVPSIAFLNLAIQAYFSNFQPIFPIIHAHSFRPHSESGILILSICSWDTYLANPRRSNANMFGIQAAVIGQMFGLLMGRPKFLVQVDMFHGTCIAWTRYLKLSQAQAQEPELNPTQLKHLDGQELEAAWRRWAKGEERKRLMLALLLQDAEIASLLHHDPLVRYSVDSIPGTASKEAFCAPDAKSWKTVMINEASSSSMLERHTSQDGATQSSLPLVSNDFELLVMLRCIGALPLLQQNLSALQNGTSQCHDALISWYKRYRACIAFKKQEPGLMMLWHSMFMLSRMNLDILECFCGREGPAISETYRETVKSWANSDNGMLCAIHALLVIKHFERLPIGSEPPINSGLCLYRCGIAWYCYITLADKTALRARQDPRIPELQVVGSTGGFSLLQNAALKDVKVGASLLFRIIHLLQRASHWQLSRNLASTLLSLVEDETEVF